MMEMNGWIKGIRATWCKWMGELKVEGQHDEKWMGELEVAGQHDVNEWVN